MDYHITATYLTPEGNKGAWSGELSAPHGADIIATAKRHIEQTRRVAGELTVKAVRVISQADADFYAEKELKMKTEGR